MIFDLDTVKRGDVVEVEGVKYKFLSFEKGKFFTTITYTKTDSDGNWVLNSEKYRNKPEEINL